MVADVMSQLRAVEILWKLKESLISEISAASVLSSKAHSKTMMTYGHEAYKQRLHVPK